MPKVAAVAKKCTSPVSGSSRGGTDLAIGVMCGRGSRGLAALSVGPKKWSMCLSCSTTAIYIPNICIYIYTHCARREGYIYIFTYVQVFILVVTRAGGTLLGFLGHRLRGSSESHGSSTTLEEAPQCRASGLVDAE